MNTSAFADEGMWLFNAPPLKQLKKTSVRAEAAVARTSAKIECSFQFRRERVIRFRKRPVITNHHVGADTCRNQRREAQLSAGWFLREHASG
jgi:hypothetical protein